MSLMTTLFPLGALGVGLGALIVYVLQVPAGQFSDWQLIVVAFAAGGLAMQQRTIIRTMVTKEDLAKFQIDINDKYAPKSDKARGASA